MNDEYIILLFIQDSLYILKHRMVYTLNALSCVLEFFKSVFPPLTHGIRFHAV